MSRLGMLLVLAGAAAGCTGYVNGETYDGSNDPDDNAHGGGSGPTAGSGGQSVTDPNQPPTAQVSCASTATETVGHRALRRLTNGELEATVRAIFEVDTAQWPGVNLPSDSGSLDGFTNNVDSLTVGPDYVKGTLEGAKKIASIVTSDANLTKFAPCLASGDAACAASFVTTIGAKLYRRPLTSGEQARFTGLYDKIKANAEDFKSFAYWATTALLQSPHVIYRSEIGNADGARFKLDSYEIATQLAYTFTGGPPSAALTQLAASNQLGTADQIEAAARSLVFDGQTVKPAFKDVLLRFSDQWLGLGALANLKKDDALYPQFSSAVQDAMGEETRRFISAVMFEDKGNVASLLTAPFTFVDGSLAQYYGYGMAAGADFVRVQRPASAGLGLLAQGSVMAVQANSLATSPTRRGHMVRVKLLCGHVPPPPAVVGEIPAPTATRTTRERYEVLHAANASCNGCHALMDPIGFAFEHLDSAGRYREQENTFPIDDSGMVTGTSSGDVTVAGAAGLSTALSKLPEVTDCVSSYLGAYALGVNHDSASCLVSNAASELRGGSSLIDFYVRIARSEHFRSRQ
jgi:hypothetical protein